MTQVNWNGKDLPEELKELPPGRYVVYPADGVLDLTPEEDEDLRAALEEADRDPGVAHEDVVSRLRVWALMANRGERVGSTP